MKIVLRQDYEHLGKTGDIVEVRPGYARNFLLPRQIAYPAKPNFIKKIEEETRQKQFRLNKERVAAEELAKKLSEVSLTISVNVGEEDKMFGSVTSQDIAAGLAEQGFEIDRRKIDLEEPIKALGIYSVPVKLHKDVVANIKVWVVKE
jgi:large subunit ribosomal protein L9